jgi:L-cysteine desulfidase
MQKDEIIRILKQEMIPGLGVTEPAAIALACAKAYEAVKGNFINLKVTCDSGIYKNAFSCKIPGTNVSGCEMSALLGVLCGDSTFELEVLKNVTNKFVEKAVALKKQGLASFEVKKGMKRIYIEALVNTDKGYGRAVIENSHSNFILVEVNGIKLYEKKIENNASQDASELTVKDLKFSEIINFIDNASYKDLIFIMDAVNMNKALAFEGARGAGMKIGKLFCQEYKLNENNYETYALMLTSCAIDARVGGVSLPAMTITGSGNHGIISTMPLAAVAKVLKLSNENLVKAIALSWLVNIYIKEFSGKLSAFCGCAVAAGTGAASGITYLLGGNKKQIENTIKNMAVNITGMICSGGNEGCTLKAITGTQTAFLSSKLALKNIVIPNACGIIDESIELTMKNIGAIASPGMVNTDNTIIDIMLKNKK